MNDDIILTRKSLRREVIILKQFYRRTKGLVLLLVVCFLASVFIISDLTVVHAEAKGTWEMNGWISYSGVYKKKIKGKTYYISLNEYTSKYGEKNDGAVYVFKGKSNYKKFNYCWIGYIRRVKKNQYKCINEKGKVYFTFTIKNSKTIVVKQKRKIVKGVNLKGKYKLYYRFLA